MTDIAKITAVPLHDWVLRVVIRVTADEAERVAHGGDLHGERFREARGSELPDVRGALRAWHRRRVFGPRACRLDGDVLEVGCSARPLLQARGS